MLNVICAGNEVKFAPDPTKLVAVIMPEAFILPVTSNFCVGIALPRPTLPSSSTVTTCDVPSCNRTKSPDPLCVTAIATLVLVVSTSILSTSTNWVSSVVVVPLTVRSPVTVAFPVIAASLTVILSVLFKTTAPVRP